MKHPAWLAAGLLVFALLACNLSKNNNNGNNTNSNTNRSPSADVYVDQVHMAKDDNGEPGASTTTFSPSERTVRGNYAQ
jgi:hypothetical protein